MPAAPVMALAVFVRRCLLYPLAPRARWPVWMAFVHVQCAHYLGALGLDCPVTPCLCVNMKYTASTHQHACRAKCRRWCKIPRHVTDLASTVSVHHGMGSAHKRLRFSQHGRWLHCSGLVDSLQAHLELLSLLRVIQKVLHVCPLC